MQCSHGISIHRCAVHRSPEKPLPRGFKVCRRCKVTIIGQDWVYCGRCQKFDMQRWVEHETHDRRRIMAQVCREVNAQ